MARTTPSYPTPHWVPPHPTHPNVVTPPPPPKKKEKKSKVCSYYLYPVNFVNYYADRPLSLNSRPEYFISQNLEIHHKHKYWNPAKPASYIGNTVDGPTFPNCKAGVSPSVLMREKCAGFHHRRQNPSNQFQSKGRANVNYLIDNK